MKGIDISITPIRGSKIRDVCDSAKVLSEYLGYDITFKFNGVTITTENHSINDMVDRYMTQG